MRVGQKNALAVTPGQNFGLAVVTVLIDWTDSVDDVLSHQLPAGCDDGPPGRQPSHLGHDLPAFREDGGTAGTMDRAVHATSAQKRRIRGIDDRVRDLSADVGRANKLEDLAVSEF